MKQRMKFDPLQGLKLVSLNQVNYKQMLHEVTTTFCNYQPLCHHLDATPDDLEPLFHPIINKCVDFDFSMACVNEKGEPISIITNMAYKDYLKLKTPEQCPKKTSMFIETLGAIEEAYHSEDPDNAVLSFTWSTRQDYARKGIFSKMMEIVLQMAKKQGYKTVLADCMNNKSQDAAKKLGFVPKAQVFYQPFILKDGTTPYKGLPAEQSVVRMIKYL